MGKNLKEFKKWWEAVSQEGDWDYEHYAAIGWERALEWALSLNSVRIHDDVYEDINKELLE